MAVGACAELRRLYENAIYTAELPGGTVTWCIGAGVQGPVPPRPLAILTAWNPGRARPGAAANREANRRLAAALKTDGFEIYSASAAAADGTHREPSFAITPATPAQALVYARRFRQAAAFFWDGRVGGLLWTDCAESE